MYTLKRIGTWKPGRSHPLVDRVAWTARLVYGERAVLVVSEHELARVRVHCPQDRKVARVVTYGTTLTSALHRMLTRLREMSGEEAIL